MFFPSGPGGAHNRHPNQSPFHPDSRSNASPSSSSSSNFSSSNQKGTLTRQQLLKALQAENGNELSKADMGFLIGQLEQIDHFIKMYGTQIRPDELDRSSPSYLCEFLATICSTMKKIMGYGPPRCATYIRLIDE